MVKLHQVPSGALRPLKQGAVCAGPRHVLASQFSPCRICGNNNMRLAYVDLTSTNTVSPTEGELRPKSVHRALASMELLHCGGVLSKPDRPPRPDFPNRLDGIQ